MNIDSYNAIADDWNTARRSFVLKEKEYLDALLAVVGKGETVLDLGCGTGTPMAAYVVAQGRRVVGVDQAGKLLERARRSFPSETWISSTIEEYDFAHGFKAAILWDSLFHIRREEHEPILRRVVEHLPVSGRLMLTVGGSEGPAFTDTMFGHKFFYDSNTPEQTEQILQRLGCRLLIAEFMNPPTGGRDKGRYAIVAEKAA